MSILLKPDSGSGQTLIKMFNNNNNNNNTCRKILIKRKIRMINWHCLFYLQFWYSNKPHRIRVTNARTLQLELKIMSLLKAGDPFREEHPKSFSIIKSSTYMHFHTCKCMCINEFCVYCQDALTFMIAPIDFKMLKFEVASLISYYGFFRSPP